MKQFVIKNWRHITLMSGLFACLVVGIFLVFYNPTSKAVPQVTANPAAISTSNTQKVEAASDTVLATDSSPSTDSQTNTKSSNQNSASTTTPALQTATSTQTTQPASLNVTLQVNGHTVGNVRIASGSNQCDVLSAALDQGVINNLDMRYYASYGSYGVYVINGQGDHNVIWWAYTVDKVSPPVGCSGQKVNGGETINWEYTGR